MHSYQSHSTFLPKRSCLGKMPSPAISQPLGDWQQDGRGVRWIVIDALLGNTQVFPRGQWFPAAKVPDKTRMRTAGDLNAETLPLEEAASGRPELEPDPQAAIGLWR